MPSPQERLNADESSHGVFGFFRDFGVRETIESIIIAVVLALMFRAYEAEAFIIPTGSMAPSLQGQHMDLECENCELRYRTGASAESSTSLRRDQIDSTFCPICQYRTRMKGSDPDHVSNNGDRILVNKFIYDFEEPERFDVIVFKNPNNGKQNYIKRLIGLPGDNILIENGDIYLLNDSGDGKFSKEIARKPPEKLRHVLQAVDDTNHIGDNLTRINWPQRWQSFDKGSDWETRTSGEHPTYYSAATTGENWIRYRHFQPLKSEWQTIENDLLPDRFVDGNLPSGRLIGDQYGYNDGLYTQDLLDEYGQPRKDFGQNLGLHWVGDIGLEAWADVKSPQGLLLLDLVEGGAHFTCEIDVATGKATLLCDDEGVDTKVTFRDADGKAIETPTADTNLDGPGKYHIEYVNADDRLNLWINGKLIEFDAPEYTRTGIPVPVYRADDPGDAEPAGVGAKGLEVSLSRLKVNRDIYYTSAKGQTSRGPDGTSSLENETGAPDVSKIETYHRSPERWNEPEVISFFRKKKGRMEPMFRLKKGATAAQDQFLPMGDNSPRSLDGRVWNGENYVERDMLIGRAMLIYWPHTKNKPIKYFPNFERMGFIR